ncbi:hypothetical protein L3V77_18280 [Vibrio sp. DW001]|uniref:hypothetical protein n=1 Tax=Vibrio sp. DW001 TaxID=2912315 RepID=UPI0023B083FB|nr:hypothetical protein [Vibrio sp. DW001]WED29377.1 hypothetical protein L3V77_18280 [Vibrio sp. DW001]
MKYVLVAFLAVFLVACKSTPQEAVSLDTNFFSNDELTVGVIYIPPQEKATTYIYGASCLLCYGVASALTEELDDHLESTISTTELESIKSIVLSEYSEFSHTVELSTLPISIKDLPDFKDELGFAPKDFRSLKESLNIDLLVVLNIPRHGAIRSFNNYFPVSDPKGYIAGLIYSVDLNTNSYVQYLDFTKSVQPLGDWDEPSDFPSVTTSYYQTVENIKQKIKDAI